MLGISKGSATSEGVRSRISYGASKRCLRNIRFKRGCRGNNKENHMPDLDYQKQAQEYYGKAPVIIMGSGASAAYGMSGMWALAQHLIAHTDVSGLSGPELDAWKHFCHVLNSGVDLESALQQVETSEELTSRIVSATWSLINFEDLEIFQKSLQDSEMFSLSRLLEHMFKSSLGKINII